MTEHTTTTAEGHPAAGATLRVAHFAELTGTTLYALLRLRAEVFVVEQDCPYQDLDLRDLEPGTRHLWLAEPDGQPLAYVRLLRDPGDVARIGRVCTAESARGRGGAGRLIDTALELAVADGARTAVLNAQAHLAGYYGRWGFTPCGPEYLEDGIPHVPMTRDLGDPDGR